MNSDSRHVAQDRPHEMVVAEIFGNLTAATTRVVPPPRAGPIQVRVLLMWLRPCRPQLSGELLHGLV